MKAQVTASGTVMAPRRRLRRRISDRYDPRDLAEIRVFHHDRFLGRAICPDLAAATVSLKEITAARRRELKRQIGERASVVDRLIAVHTPPPPSPPAATLAANQPVTRLKCSREE
jgi:putative transposase